MQLPSYGVKRIEAAVVGDPALSHITIRNFDRDEQDVAAYVEEIVDFSPQLIGISVYVWSTPCLVEVARQVKRHLPQSLIVFGGPSGRTAVFDLDIYPDPLEFLDAVVETEGEMIFNQLAHLPDTSLQSLKKIGGLFLPAGDGEWHETGQAMPIARLDDIVSPYQLDLMPYHAVAYLETFRGCPMACRFCEWGQGDSSTTVFSKDYILREFEAFERCDASAVFLVDAGLNLNKHAFENLRQAERESNYLKNSGGLWSEIYPSIIKDEHMEFLAEVGVGYLGIGLQSMDPVVLKEHQRGFSMDRFESSVHKIASVFQAEIQIIMGLPADTPAGFKRTLEFARSMPVSVRAYHCLVLPDALLTRGKDDWDIYFDPTTMEMISCKGWSEEDILETRAYLDNYAKRAGGTAGDFWWYFPRTTTAQNLVGYPG